MMSSSSSTEDGQVCTVWLTTWWINATSESRVLKDPERENLAMIGRSYKIGESAKDERMDEP